MAKKKNPWDRIITGDKKTEESEPAYAAFLTYIAIGTGRKYPQVAQKCAKNLSLIKRWAARFNWQERAIAWDTSIVQEAHDKAVADYTAMIERHIKEGQLLQKKAIDGLKDRDTSKASFHSLVLMFSNGVEIEREAREQTLSTKGEEHGTGELLAEVLKAAWNTEGNSNGSA